MLISINIAYCLISILTFFSFLIPKKRKYDLIIFPYAQKGSDGYKRRFEVYFDFLKQENISYKICDIIDNDLFVKIIDGSFGKRYLFFQKTIWKRIWQVYSARNYKAVFIQRGLFVLYPDQKFPYLERLIYRLNGNITIDFWDSFWVYNPKLVNKAVLYANKVACVNNFILDYFQFSFNKKFLFPIGVNLDLYKIKLDYSIEDPIRFIYTGLPSNVETFLQLSHPVFISLKSKIDFKLILITRYRCEINDYPVEFYDFNEDTFYDQLLNADVGLYFVKDSEISKGKMAMKVLDYMSAGLPCVASPFGLSPYAVDKENILLANSVEEWVDNIIVLKEDINIRKKIGENGRKMVEQFHDVKSSFNIFKESVLNK